MRRLHDDHDSRQCLLDTFRRAVASAGGVESVAAHIKVSPSYISAICNDKSPLGVRVILKSPEAVQRFLAEAWVESKGGMVIWPAKDKESALKSLLGAAIQLIGRQMLKASLFKDEQRKAG